VEEENTVSTILDRLRMVGDDRTGLLFLDKELSTRVGAIAANAPVVSDSM
jgi:ferritin